MSTPAPFDAVMRALAEPTRRAVYERIVRAEEISVADLTRGSGVTQGAVSQHLKTLKQAGLVAERPQGRNVFYRAGPMGLAPLADWLKHYERFWTGRLDSLERFLREEDERNPQPEKGNDP